MSISLFKFKGGVKPPTHKSESTGLPIARAPLPSRLVVPLHQSIGGIPRPVVTAGDKVLKGQLIGEADGWISAAVHAPTSGTVLEVAMHPQPHPSGLDALCVAVDTYLGELVAREERMRALYVLMGEALGPVAEINEVFAELNRKFRDSARGWIQTGVATGEIRAEGKVVWISDPVESAAGGTAILGDDGVELVTGAAGGPRIVSTTLQMLLRVLVFGQDATLRNVTQKDLRYTIEANPYSKTPQVRTLLVGAVDRIARNLVKFNALHRLAPNMLLKRLDQVPGDRFALAIRVGREIDLLCFPRQLLELFDNPLLLVRDAVLGLKVVLYIH